MFTMLEKSRSDGAFVGKCSFFYAIRKMPWSLRLASFLLILSLWFPWHRSMSWDACWLAKSASVFDRSCLRWVGNSAFRAFAKKPEAHSVAATPTTACFPNHHDAGDWLCIFREFDKGKTSVDMMACKDLENNLHQLFKDGWELRKRHPDTVLEATSTGRPEHICFHKNGAGSVQWTHAHLFQDLPPPDGMQLNGSDVYCTTVGPLDLGLEQSARVAASRITQKLCRGLKHSQPGSVFAEKDANIQN
jgi:hypothetical protein